MQCANELSVEDTQGMHEQMVAEVDRLMRVHRDRLVSGSVAADGGRLEFTTTDLELLSSEDPRSLLGAGYPVHVEYGEPPVAC